MDIDVRQRTAVRFLYVCEALSIPQIKDTKERKSHIIIAITIINHYYL